LVGAVLGTVLSRRAEALLSEPSEAKTRKIRQRKASQLEADSMEVARLSLEDKIAQLNQAIDDVRLQLGDVNGNAQAPGDSGSIAQDS
jgi:hypothetical protein